jgi:hypothetical protein
MARTATRTQGGGKTQRPTGEEPARKEATAAESNREADAKQQQAKAKAPGPATAGRGGATSTATTGKKKPEEEGAGEQEESTKKDDFWQDLVAHAWNSSRRRKEEE